MSLNEIKCSETMANDLLYLDNYVPIFKCRNHSGRGVALLIREDIESEEIFLPEDFEAEIIGAKVKINKKNIAIFSYYNPPNIKISKEIFTNNERIFQNYLILGDLNAKTSRFNSKPNLNGRLLEEILLCTNDNKHNKQH